jgi:hypothetical protein
LGPASFGPAVFFVGSPKRLVLRRFVRSLAAKRLLYIKSCGADAPTLASLRDHVRHCIFDREERTDQIDARDFLPMIDGLVGKRHQPVTDDQPGALLDER